MIQRRRYIFQRLNNLLDGFITAVVFEAVYLTRNSFDEIPLLQSLGPIAPFESYAPLMLIASFLWPVCLNYQGLYAPTHLRKAFVNVGIIFRSSAIATLLLVSIVFLFRIETISRLALIIFGVANAFILVLKDLGRRQYVLRRRLSGKDIRPVMIVGTPETVQEAIRKVRDESYLGLVPTAVVLPSSGRYPEEIEDVPVVGTLEQWRPILHRHPVATVLFTIYRENVSEVEEALWVCHEEGVESWLFIQSLGWTLPQMMVDEFANVPILIFRTTPVMTWAYVLKLLIDRVLALFLLAVLSPLLFVISLLVWVTSGRPIFYKQKRVGRFGQPFELYKFRTLKADGVTPTRFGGWLRHVGLDEFPQLINILRGEMSFVGPRPHVPEEVRRYAEPWQRRRFTMPPGLTCYRQILRPGKVSFDEAMVLDLKYIDHWSLWTDFFLLYKTSVLFLRRVFLRAGGT